MVRFWGSCLILLGFISCSLSPKTQGWFNLNLKIDGVQEKTSDFDLISQFVPSRSVLSSPPLNLTQFSCLAVNVMGPDIVPADGDYGSLDRLNQVLNHTSSCSYPGITSPPFSIGASDQTISLRVPSGPNRVIQVVGVNDLTNSFCKNSDNHYHFENNNADFYELGNRILGLFADQVVAVANTYDSLVSSDQEKRKMNCNSGQAGGGQAGGGGVSGPPNLEVPIELADMNLLSGTSAKVFDETRTSFDTNDYDGNPSYFFEVVAQNNDTVARTISLVDSASNTVFGSTITLVASAAPITRYRVAITPSVGINNYRVQFSATGSSTDLRLYAARILVKQTAATKTKIYIPLASNDFDAGTSEVANTTATSDVNNNFSFSRNDSVWKKNLAAPAFQGSSVQYFFEAVLSGSSGHSSKAALYEFDTQNQVPASLISTAAGAPDMQVSSAFDETSAGFNLSGVRMYEVKFFSDTSGYSAHIYKAGLWVKIQGLTSGEVYYRVGKGNTTTVVQGDQRVLLDTGVFSNPSIYHEAVGLSVPGSSGKIDLIDDGVNESGSGGVAVGGGSLLTLGSTKGVFRTGSLAITSGHRFTQSTNVGGGSTDVSNNFIVVGFH